MVSPVSDVDRARRSVGLADHEVESAIVLPSIRIDEVALVLLFHLTGEEIEESGVISGTLLTSLFSLFSGRLLVHSVVKIQKAECHDDENDEEVHDFEGDVPLHFELVPVLVWDLRERGLLLLCRCDVS